MLSSIRISIVGVDERDSIFSDLQTTCVVKGGPAKMQMNKHCFSHILAPEKMIFKIQLPPLLFVGDYAK